MTDLIVAGLIIDKITDGKAIDSLTSPVFITSGYKVLLNCLLDLKKLWIPDQDLVLKDLLSLLTIKGSELVQKYPWTGIFKKKQKKRHRCTEQTFGLCGRRRGWDVLREQHQNMYIIKDETGHQLRLDAWDKCSGLVHWEDPEGWGGEGGGRGDWDGKYM